LAGSRCTDGSEDSGADHRANRQHDQVTGAEAAFQAAGALRFGHQLRNRLPLKELGHHTEF
jgi:hypothetical protein